jgi:DNA topoisomerase-2
MQKELDRGTNQARFIQMIIDGKLVVAKKKKLDLIAELKQMGFKSFPKIADTSKEGKLESTSDNEESNKDVATGANGYDYLLGVSNPSSVSLDDPNKTIDAYLVAD